MIPVSSRRRYREDDCRDGAAMYGQQSMWSSKKLDGEWGRLIFIFLGVEIITITCGIRSRGGKM